MESQFRSLPEFTRSDLRGPTVKLWIAAFVFYGIGDVVTTVLGLSSGALVEASPFVIPVIERFGFPAVIGLKAGVFGFTGLLWMYTPYPDRLGVPIGLTTIGLLVTGWNTYLLLIFGI